MRGTPVLNSKGILGFLKVAVFSTALVVIYFKLFHDKDTARILSHALGPMLNPLGPLLIVVLSLTLVNWLIEAKKWHYLVAKFEAIPFWRAFKATIAGTCFSLFTPNRVGEFVGRVIFITPKGRSKAVFATIVGSIAQFLVTILMGSIGALWFLSTNVEIVGIQGLGLNMMLSLSVILAFICALVYFQPSIIRGLFNNVPWLKKWRQAILVLDRYDRASLLIVLLLSLLRYLVFSTQFVLLLHFFEVDISIPNAYCSVFLVYLISTILPTVIFSELGVRELVAWSVMSTFTENEIGIVAASFVLWVINLLVPAAVGAFIVLFTKVEWAQKKAAG